jgi:hypothetical protein
VIEYKEYIKINTTLDSRMGRYNVQVWHCYAHPHPTYAGCQDSTCIYGDCASTRELARMLADNWLDSKPEYKGIERVHDR